MTSPLEQALARLQETSDSEIAMRPYKAKTPTQMRLHTDPAHRMMREAYKRRTGSDKNKAARYRKVYYRKNRSQLKQRQKRSTQLHHPASDQHNSVISWVANNSNPIDFKDVRFPKDQLAMYENLGGGVYYDGVDTIMLLKHGLVVGLLYFTGKKSFTVKYAIVNKKYSGMGLGQIMYEKALGFFKRLRSDTSLSPSSSALWAKLCQKYDGYLIVGRKRVKIEGFSKINGVTYPIVNTDKGPKTLKSLCSYGTAVSKESARSARYGITLGEKI